jgi:hypothetical protein
MEVRAVVALGLMHEGKIDPGGDLLEPREPNCGNKVAIPQP